MDLKFPQIPYLGVTFHYMQRCNFLFKNKVLGLVYLSEDHDKEYLNMKLKETLKEWKVLDKVI